MDVNRVLEALRNGGGRRPRRQLRRTGLPMGGGGQGALIRMLVRLLTNLLRGWGQGGGQAPRRAPASRAPSRKPGGTRRSTGLPDWATAPTPTAPLPTRSARLPDWTASPQAPPAAEPVAAETAEALLMIRAMVAAAAADGQVAPEERAAIAAQLDNAGLSAEERDFVLADFAAPLTPEALAAQARDPMLRARLYAAAVAAMNDITAPERAWLDRLGKALGLDRQAARTIEERFE